MLEETRKAVILARGLGKRMRSSSSTATHLTEEQQRLADAGIKGMMPIRRPFLDYCIHALADAGIRHVCLVIGPEHTAIREYYETLATRRVSISFAVQPKPLGTADALRAAEAFVAQESFLVVNSDNYYPVEALHLLRTLGSNAVVGFEPTALIEQGNITEDRLRGYAALHMNAVHALESIVEKPDSAEAAALVGMNCWSFTPMIFQACTEIGPSSRGEYEIPTAVQFAIDHLGERFTVIPFCGGVLDLSTRGDIAGVTRFLQESAVEL